MTAAPTQTALPLRTGGVCLRACGFGLAACAALFGAVLASGTLPAGSRDFVLLGFLVAAVSGSLGTSLQAVLSTTPAGHPNLTQRYLLGMVGHFVLQVLAVAGGCVALVLLETKFQATAAFALAFAVAATTLHTVGAVVVSRALGARARMVGAVPTRPEADGQTQTTESQAESPGRNTR